MLTVKYKAHKWHCFFSPIPRYATLPVIFLRLFLSDLIMSKIKITLVSLVLIACAVAAWVFIPTHTSLGSKIMSVPIGDEFSLVGYKIASTDRKLNKMNQFYLIANGTELGDDEPVLISSDQFLRVVSIKDNTFKLSVKGRIEQYRNDLWVEKSDGTVHHWLVSMQSDYVK